MAKKDDSRRPGWYLRADLHNTQCYWDGTAWTDKVAPALPAEVRVTWTGKGLLTFVLVVYTIGIVLVFLLALGGNFN